MGEITAQQNAPQLQLDGMGEPFVYDAATRTLSPVTGGEGFQGGRSQQVDQRALASLIPKFLPLDNMGQMYDPALVLEDGKVGGYRAPTQDDYAKATALAQQALGGQPQGGQQARTVVRTGTVNGKRVAEYSDGSIEEVN